MKQALHIKNLTKKYKDFTLDHISLDLPYGMILGLIGENGSGKSTLINSILNIVKADYDEVHILGQDLKSQEKEIKKEIAVIFNDSHYGENLTPLFIGKMLSGIYTDWDQKKFTDYLKQFHLPEKKRLKTFSTGMKVKLEFAAALSHNPKLLILDEATNGLDPVFREEILEILREFTEQEDHSVLISSHITSDLDKIADYIAYIHEGRLLFLKSIDELNNLMFQENSSTYAVLRAVMRYLEISNSVIMIIIVAGGMLLLIQATRNMFVPLSNMAETAQLVGQGNFHVKMHDTDAQDELGTVTRAFNTMVENLDLYMARTKASMEKEQQMMERELLMENHLKEAQLKYLQSQINPHFLFNSLNAGAQLAMMEDAEQTGIFVEKMADFFRYNVKKGQEDATLGEELEAVDNYIYILNVRFAGDIHFSKEVDESLENVRMPSMILQPVVENAVNHGIRDIEWEGKIHLTVTGDADYIRISVKDNGKGMTQEQIEGVLSGNRERRNEEGDSTGIGMNNVISRLELYYEESGLMEINSEGEGKGTEAVIYIPVHEN